MLTSLLFVSSIALIPVAQVDAEAQAEAAAQIESDSLIEPAAELHAELETGEEPQVEPSSTSASASAVTLDEDFVERSLATLSALRDSRKTKQAQLQRLRDNFDPELTGELRLKQLDELRQMQADIDKLVHDFESVATGIDVSAFYLRSESEFDLIGELESLLQPILSELRSATEAPREMERLRAAMDYATEHEGLAQNAIDHLNRLIEVSNRVESQPDVIDALTESRDAWQGRLKELDNRRTVAQFQLEQRESRKASFVDSAQEALGEFFRTRGLNLLLAGLVFFATLLGLRAAHRATRLLVRKTAGAERKFYARLIDVLYFGFSGLAAMGGAMLVLYSSGDWAVLGVSILVLLGLGWASKTAIPVFFEQIKILLNLGTVRDGERVTVHGLPWRVARLSLNTQLVNKELEGGRLRIPLRDLTELRSRPTAKGERWFPTSLNDWVLLDDSRLARVEFQSPEAVRLELQGGSKVQYSATAFFEANFECLSRGFRVNQRFGIDYEYQSICTDEVPKKMHAAVSAGLKRRFDPEFLLGLKVEFLEAGASSLDYAVLADFSGDAAPRYSEISRALQALLVDVCNEEGWSIPFTQLTLHTAPTDAPLSC